MNDSKICKSEEDVNVLDLSTSGQSDNLDFVWAMVRLQVTAYIWGMQEVMEFAFYCMGEKAIVWSLQSTSLYMVFVLRDVV